MSKRWIASLILTLLLTIIYLSSVLQVSYAASAVLVPANGPVGTSVHVSGGGFTPLSSVDIYWNNVTLLTSCTTNNFGAINPCHFFVPSATAGQHIVGVTDYTVSAYRNFTVTSALALSATSGQVGNMVKANGTGFAASATVHFTWDGTPLSSPPCVSNATGSFPCSFSVPVAGAGPHTVGASDGINSVNATFTLMTTPTSLSVNCSPSNLSKGNPTTCRATVSPSSAVGSVTWTADQPGSFNATSCMMSAGSCAVQFVPSKALLIVSINATYSGTGFTNSSKSTQIAVAAATSDFPAPVLLSAIIFSGGVFTSLLRRRILKGTSHFSSRSQQADPAMPPDA